VKLYHQGQLEGKTIKLPVQLRTIKIEKPDEEIRSFYEKLLFITKQDVFHEGEWQLKEVSSFADESFQNIIAYTWESSLRTKLVVVNLSRNLSQGRIPLMNELTGEGDCIFLDELNNQQYVRKCADIATAGLHVILDGYKAHVFDIS
jgi:hypothetical protein